MVVTAQSQDGKLKLKAVNSCIQLLPTLDGKALFTIEDIASAKGAMHPIQDAMVQSHASQCGFCTPGFVMSLWAQYQQREEAGAPTLAEIHDCLSGNLCRCTGYRAIATAAQSAYSVPRVHQETDVITEALHGLRRDRMFSYEAEGRQFFAPRSLAELSDAQERHPDAVLIAGTTDVGLWITQQLRELDTLIYLGEVQELQSIQEHDDMLEIGGAVTLEDAYHAICKHHPKELTQFWRRFASLPIRNMGTFCGNIANGSPIGDSMPWLLVLDAQLVLHSAAEERVVPLHRFYLGYQKKDLRPGEVVKSVRIPLPTQGLRWRTYKLSKRFDQDISAVCAAFAVNLDENGIIQSARVAFGGMAASPQRAPHTEAALVSKRWDEQALEQAELALSEDYSPISDMRASSDYRKVSAKQLLRRFWLETRAHDPLPEQAVNVFAVNHDAESI